MKKLVVWVSVIFQTKLFLMLKHNTVLHELIPWSVVVMCKWLKSCSVFNRATIEEVEGDVCELESKLDKVRQEERCQNVESMADVS